MVDTSAMDDFREDIKLAVKTTSLKGLPRILSSKSWLHKAIWSIAVISLFIVCVISVKYNFDTYTEYPKVVDVEEKRISRQEPNSTVPFPMVTVCNLNQFGSNRAVFEQNGIPFPKDYHAKVKELTSCSNCSEQKADLSEYVKRMLLNSKGYYQYVGLENMKKVSNQNLILHCHALVLTGTSYVMYPCEEFSTNYSYVLPETGLCYAFEAKPFTRKAIVGYKFILHTDSSVDNLNTEFDPDFDPSGSLGSGAVVIIADPYVIPRASTTSPIVPTGMSTKIIVNAVRTDRMTTPYGRRECINAEEFTKVPYNGKLFNYDFTHCYSQCNLAYTASSCNCTDLFLVDNVEIEPPKYEYCASLKQSREELFEKMSCADSSKRIGFMTCLMACRASCKQIDYKLSTSTAKWPIPSQLGSFYKNIIQQHPNLQEIYGHLTTSIEPDFKNLSDPHRLFISKLVEENFAQLTVIFPALYYTHYETKAKIFRSDLISQLGGSLNLWSGITMILAIEILDLTITLVGRCFEGKKTEEKADGVVDNDIRLDIRGQYSTEYTSAAP